MKISDFEESERGKDESVQEPTKRLDKLRGDEEGVGGLPQTSSFGPLKRLDDKRPHQTLETANIQVITNFYFTPLFFFLNLNLVPLAPFFF